MPFKIDLNPKVEIHTSIGRVFIYETTPDAIDKYAQQPEGDPLPKVRQFLEQIATTTARDHRDNHVSLTEAETKALSDDDIERMAEGYLKMPNSLHCIAEGREAKPPVVRGKDESAVAFLDRELVFRVKHERDSRRQLADMFKSQTRALIEQTFGPSAEALRQLDIGASGLTALVAEARRHQSAIDELRHSTATPQVLDVRPQPAFEAVRRAEERRRQERKEELDLARSTREMTLRSAEHLAQLSQTTTTMLGQFGDFLARFVEASRRADRGSRLALWIAVCSLVVTAILASMSYLQDASNNQSTDKWQAEASRALNKQVELTERSLRALSAENAKLLGRVEALEKGRSATDSRRSDK